ncbi:MAG: pitrilysin family protein [Phycisphaerae bacterium]
MQPSRFVHRRLDCGIEFAAAPIPGRKIVALELRVLGGMVTEPADELGVAFLTEQTLSKGTARRTGPELSDAFDALGALHGSWVSRESIGFRGTCLPEHLDAMLDLHAELIRTPTFPDDSCRVAVELATQELTLLEDDPGELSRKLLMPHAYGPILGRHAYGDRATLARLSRPQIANYWRANFHPARMQVVLGGAVDPARAADRLEKLFGDMSPRGSEYVTPAVAFSAGAWHYHKELEQQHVGICWPGVPVRSDAHPVERVMLAILGEGMSSRLFTEVREKQGLVYWVGAWHEHPRAAGMIHLGASSTPARCAQTCRTLLREVERLAEDITPDELERAKTLLTARSQTHGDLTRARTSELSADLFFHGCPMPIEEKNAAINRVTIDDIRAYLAAHPRDRRCVVTLGPAEPAPEAS